jgi:hypothetical protein
VVAAYHELFFSVRDRMQARDWVLAMAVGSHPASDFAGPQPAGLWRYAAFTGGPLVLDLIVAVTTDGPLPVWVRGTLAADHPWGEPFLRLRVKLAIAALAPSSGCRLGSLAELSEQLRDLDEKAGMVLATDRPLLPVLGDLLAAPGRRGPPEPGVAADSPAPALKREQRTQKVEQPTRALQPLLQTSDTGADHGQKEGPREVVRLRG